MQKGIRPSEAELREMGRRIDKALETIPAMTYAQMGRLVNSYTRRIHSLSRTLYFERGGSWEMREVDSKHRESNYYDVTRLAVKKYVVRRDPEDGHLLIGRKTDVFHAIAVQDIQVAMMRDRMDERGWTMIYSGKSNQMGKHVRMRYMDEYEIGMYLVPFRLMSEKAYRHVHGYLHRMQRLHGDDAIRVVLLIKKSGYASAVKSMKDWLSRNSDVSHALYALPYEDVVQNPEYYFRSIFDYGAWSYETLERMVGVKSGGEFYQKYSEGKDWMIGGGTIVAKVNETWSVLAAWNGNIASLIQWGHLGDEAFASVSVKGERISAYLWLTAPNALMGEVMHKLAHSKGVKRLTDMPSLQEVEVKECFYDPDQEDEDETVERGWDEVELTNEQEAAVMHGTGPALVVAAARRGYSLHESSD
ncbi:hypothetical protein [Sulfoacidibacillus ferrooxidans]|uniref:Uncharacterized protein n=1 Tax=Sulfoacidibacillus ferrooxidans TaxID=2005001 RepID=A0A9X2AEJ2_9BACL|nr:hypothetical protein [Sulfoacidibacillus ferrooxidans]MCI0184630.1 hypothetical protein [Sulfoacidibacillus ferrooxidans]